MSRYRDFDQAVDALEPITFTVKGRNYEIAGDPPVAPIMKLLAEGRISADMRQTDPKAVNEVLEALLGKTSYEQMLDDGIGVTQLQMLSEWLMEQFGFGEVLADVNAREAEAEGNGSRSPTSSIVGER